LPPTGTSLATADRIGASQNASCESTCSTFFYLQKIRMTRCVILSSENGDKTRSEMNESVEWRRASTLGYFVLNDLGIVTRDGTFIIGSFKSDRGN
jgi:hypothetical protein